MESIKLDIGCGGRGTMYPDFIGIDKHLPPESPRKPGTTYIQLDFVYTAVFPWQPGTVDEIVCFHTIEHMHRSEGLILLKRAYDLLKPGAKMYVSCPDLDLMCRKLLERDKAFWERCYKRRDDKKVEMYPGSTLADRFNYYFNQATHVYQYNQESLIEAAKEAGCEQVEAMPKGHKWNKRGEEEVGIIVTKK